MERFEFGPEDGLTPSDEFLEGVTIAPLTASLESGSSLQAAVLRLAPGGGIRRHPATVPQIMAVLEGGGEVCGGDGIFQIVGTDDAVYFPEGEEHEIRTSDGIVVLVLEGPDLSPSRR